jgi:transcription-repair coupling factor (superfamily II helicase)
MVTVGYELYTQLINEAVAQLKNSVDGRLPDNEDLKDPLESLEPLPQFEVPVVALLPDSYIKDQAQRLYYYQRMMTSRDQKTLGEVQSEVEDRYGHPPLEVRNAFTIMSLRMRAKAMGFDKVDAGQGRLAIGFKDRTAVAPRIFSILAKMNKSAYLTRETYIWPFSGSPLSAIDNVMNCFERAERELDEARSRLGVGY